MAVLVVVKEMKSYFFTISIFPDRKAPVTNSIDMTIRVHIDNASIVR